MKKGFTLVELLAVLVLLALITLITVTTVSRQFKEGQNEVYKEQLSTIKLAAEMWGSENKNILGNYSGCITITLGYLKQEGYVDENIKNPTTSENLKDDQIFINITPKNKGYKYEVVDNKDKICNIIDFN